MDLNYFNTNSRIQQLSSTIQIEPVMQVMMSNGQSGGINFPFEQFSQLVGMIGKSNL